MSNPACVFDKSLKLQCVAIESTGLSYYTNSTVWTETAVNDNIADDTDHCTIVAAPNNCILVACSGTDQDDVDLWSPCLNGWGDTNRVQIQAGSTNPSDPSMIIDYDGRIHLFTDLDSDARYCKSHYLSMSSWTCFDYNSSPESTDGTITENNDVIFGYSDGASILARNSSDSSYGTKFNDSFMTATDGTARYSSFAYQRYPDNIKITNLIPYLFTDSTGSVVYYSNVTVPYQADLLNITQPSIIHLPLQQEIISLLLSSSRKIEYFAILVSTSLMQL